MWRGFFKTEKKGSKITVARTRELDGDIAGERTIVQQLLSLTICPYFRGETIIVANSIFQQ